MKRKIFSKLLMVALVIAAVGSFVSCKDYDDDINNLQKQIDNAALKSSVDALQSTLDSKITAAQNAAAAAQTAADKAATAAAAAQKTADAAQTKAQVDAAIEAAKTAASAAANEYADKVATAAQTAAAKEAYDQAKAYVDAEVAKVTAAIPTEAAIKAIADASAAALDEALATELKAWVNEQIDAIDVKGQVDAAVADAISKIDTATANVNAIWNAVTSIELPIGDNDIWQNVNFLNFQYGKEKTNVFGNATEVNAYKAADKPKTFVAGDSIKAENVYVVRVSPVTADLSTADIKLMNSKGENLDDYVNIVAEKYNDLLTRAGETGLWKLTVTLKENIKIEDLQKATHATIKNNFTTSAAVYAFAVNNSSAAAADRFAITEYDLKPLTNKYEPTATLDFYVNGEEVADIHNRWKKDGNVYYVEAEDETKARGEENYELKWQANAAKGVVVPDTKLIEKGGSDSKTANYAIDGGDVRIAKDLLGVKVGEPIVINFDAADFMFVDRYYVLYDKNNAIESAPSEWNAWNEYSISGLGEMKKATERLVITIDDTKAEGDILGFRLYAVNYDGTLVDPDGKAFYVQVGDATGADEIVIAPSAKYNVNKEAWGYNLDKAVKDSYNSVVFAYDFSDLGFADAISLKAAGFTDAASNFTKTLTAKQTSNKTSAAADVNVKITYLTSNEVNKYGNAQTATAVNKVAYIVATVLNPEAVIDGATIVTEPFNIINPDDHDKKIATVQFYLTKGTIAGTTAFGDVPTWKSGYAPASGNTVTLYPGVDILGQVWNVAFTAADDFDVDLSKYINNLVNATTTDDDIVITVNGKDLVEDLGKTIASRYDRTTGEFTVLASEVGSKAKSNVEFNTFTLAIYSQDTEALSRTWNAGAAKTDANGQSTAKKAETQVFGATLLFDRIWDYQTYAVDYIYDDGKIDDPWASRVQKHADKLWVSYSETGSTAATSNTLWPTWMSATQTAGGKIATVAKQSTDPTVNFMPGGWKTGAASGYDDLTTGWLVGSNSAVTSFADGAFDPANYVTIKDAVVLSPNGGKNEYIEYNTSNLATLPAATNIFFKRTATAPEILPASSVEMKFQCTAVDAFGGEHKIQIPFTLVR